VRIRSIGPRTRAVALLPDSPPASGSGISDPSTAQLSADDDQSTTPERRSRRRSPRLSAGTLVVLLAPAALLLVMAWHYRWIGDDGFINLRVVQQVVSGHGPVFNRGERVEAGTSPLWIAVLSFADLVSPFRLEWIAVVLGIVGSVVGVALGTIGTRRVVQPRGRELALPIGAIVFVAIPAVWTYSTAGLEGGLSFAWLGTSWYLLTRRGLVAPRIHRPDRPAIVSVVLGLGPIVRPDFLVVSIGFLVLHLVLNRRGGWSRGLLAIAYAAAVPFAVEVFRMGYYGLLVPNTALAKEATRSNWSQGWHYLADFANTYWLAIPVVLLLGVLGARILRADTDERFATAMLAIVPVVTSLVLALYWIRVGGDWMHARVLLPAFLCFLLPTLVVATSGWRLVLAAAVVVWAVWCGFGLRESPAGHHGIIDPRWSPAAFAHGHEIVTIDDYRELSKDETWDRIRALADSGTKGVILFHPGKDLEPLPLAPGHRSTAPLVVRGLPIGMVSYAVGPDVYIADGYALADPVGSHLRIEKRGRPGHEKLVPTEWVVGRFARPGISLPLDYEAFGQGPKQLSERQVEAARRAIGCGDLRDVLEAVDEPLTPSRFLQNLFDAPRLTRFRVAPTPTAAAREICPPS